MRVHSRLFIFFLFVPLPLPLLSISHLSILLKLYLAFSKMDVRERLKMLLEGDPGLKDLNTELNKARAARPAPAPAPAADEADPAESNKAKQGVSGYALPVDFKPEDGMQYPAGGQFPLSYIRTYVVGQLPEPENKLLTQIKQDGRPRRRTPNMRLDLSGLSNYERGGGEIPDKDSDEELVTAIPVPKSFTSAVTMARFPFKYLHGENAKKVNERFYEGDKFWNRTWDLCVKSKINERSTSSLILTQLLSACSAGYLPKHFSFDSDFPSSSTAR